jgi:hypothetical protein
MIRKLIIGLEGSISVTTTFVRLAWAAVVGWTLFPSAVFAEEADSVIPTGFLSGHGCDGSVGCGDMVDPWSVTFTQTVDYGTNLALPLSLTPANTLVAPLSDLSQVGILDSIGLLNPADPLVPDFQDDFQFQTAANVTRSWAFGDDSSFSAGYGYYQNLHPNVEELDLMSHAALAQYSRQLRERLVGSINYQYVYYFLDDVSFVSQSTVTPNLLWRYSDRWDIKTTASYGNASFRNTPFLSSDNYAATGEAIWYTSEARINYLSLGSGYGYSNAVDDAFSYHVPSIYSVGRWYFGDRRQYDLLVTASYADYRFVATDPVELGVRREDHIYSFNPILSRTLNENVKLFASYFYYNSDSNLIRQLYDQNVVSLGITCNW